jgi:hypothetical protein
LSGNILCENKHKKILELLKKKKRPVIPFLYFRFYDIKQTWSIYSEREKLTKETKNCKLKHKTQTGIYSGDLEHF